jgi:phasin family protein
MYSEITDRKTIEAAFDCAATLFGGLEEITELNVQTVKTSLSEQHMLAQAAFSAESIDEIIDLQFRQIPAVVKKTFSYWRHVEDIAMRTLGGLLVVAHERLESSLRTFVEEMRIASSVPAVVGRGDNTALAVVPQPTAPAGPVTLLDSSGYVVLIGDERRELH